MTRRVKEFHFTRKDPLHVEEVAAAVADYTEFASTPLLATLLIQVLSVRRGTPRLSSADRRETAHSVLGCAFDLMVEQDCRSAGIAAFRRGAVIEALEELAERTVRAGSRLFPAEELFVTNPY